MSEEKIKVLFVCTGNSCRSQIAEGLLRNLRDSIYEVYSAGSYPSRVHPLAIEIMNEIGIDISSHSSDPIKDFITLGIDVVITVCDSARQLCPVFPGKVLHIHWSIKDPFQDWSFNKNHLDSFRETRNILENKIKSFIKNKN